MKTVTLILQADNGKKTKYVFDGNIWTFTQTDDNRAKRGDWQQVNQYGNIPAEARRDLEELIYYAERVCRA